MTDLCGVVSAQALAQTTPLELAVAGSLLARAQAFGIASTELTTTEVCEISDAAKSIITSMRGDPAPHCLLLNTYRFGPHSKGDDFRHADEVAAAKARDPLVLAERYLDATVREAIANRCAERIDAAVKKAEAAAAPTLREPVR